MQFNNACERSCHDGALVDELFDSGWSYVTHPINACALYHNSNPRSCAMVGGVYYDSNNVNTTGCYDLTSIPLAHDQINYLAFTQSDNACICPKPDFRDQ